MLCSLDWWLVTNNSVRPIGPIVKQSKKNRHLTYQSTLRSMPE